MAVRTPSVTNATDGIYKRVVWTGLLNGDTGDPVTYPDWPDRTIQVLGTFGTGGSAQIEGSLEATPSAWAILTDPQGNNIVKTAASMETVMEATSHIRPNVTAGDGTTSLTVIMIMRKAT